MVLPEGGKKLMFRDVERNNWGILLSWCFALERCDLIAGLTVAVLCVMLVRRITVFRLKRFLLTAALYVSVYLFLYFYTGVSLALPYLLLLCANNAILNEYMQSREREEDFRDSIVWLILTLCFYFAALFFPETLILDELRVRCFALITVIFLPLSFYFVFLTYFRSERRGKAAAKAVLKQR